MGPLLKKRHSANSTPCTHPHCRPPTPLHEVVARARGLLQQKILQVGIEKDFLAGLLSEVCALAKVQVTANMTMEDAVALERLVALARLSQQLYLDPISNDASGFFFRAASQNESTNLEIS